jgi:hypothetical protein
MSDIVAIVIILNGLLSLIDILTGRNLDIEYIQDSLSILLSVIYLYSYLNKV